mmetsp:Transcript_124161/g.397127  ORF Transcript_124161/g.397127 Transcript_124161/m.397127 type:complete len:207 (+) Transcript_124161:423-1043(+)
MATLRLVASGDLKGTPSRGRECRPRQWSLLVQKRARRRYVHGRGPTPSQSVCDRSRSASCLLSSMPRPKSAMWRKSPTRKASTFSSGRPRRSPPLPQSTVAAGNSSAAGRASSRLRTAPGDMAAASARACGTATGTPAPTGRTPAGERQAHNSRKISAARPAPSVDASPMSAGSATGVPTSVVQRTPNARTFSRRCTKSFSSVLGG